MYQSRRYIIHTWDYGSHKYLNWLLYAHIAYAPIIQLSYLSHITHDRSSRLRLVSLHKFLPYQTKLWGKVVLFSLHQIQNMIQGEWVGPGDVCIHDKLYSMIILIIILIIIIIIILLIFFIYYTMDSCIRSVKKRNKRRRLRKYRQFGSLKSSLSTNTGGRFSSLMNEHYKKICMFRNSLLK